MILAHTPKHERNFTRREQYTFYYHRRTLLATQEPHWRRLSIPVLGKRPWRSQHTVHPQQNQKCHVTGHTHRD